MPDDVLAAARGAWEAATGDGECRHHLGIGLDECWRCMGRRLIRAQDAILADLRAECAALRRANNGLADAAIRGADLEDADREFVGIAIAKAEGDEARTALADRDRVAAEVAGLLNEMAEWEIECCDPADEEPEMIANYWRGLGRRLRTLAARLTAPVTTGGDE